MLVRPLCLGLGVGWMLMLSAVSSAVADELAVKAGRIHTPSGAPTRGIILIRDGVIAAIGPDVPIPDGAKVIDAGDGVVTAGLVDACCMVDDELPSNYFDRWFSDSASRVPTTGDAPRCSVCAGQGQQALGCATGTSFHSRPPAAGRSLHAANLQPDAGSAAIEPPPDPYGPPMHRDDRVCRVCSAAQRFPYLLDDPGEAAGAAHGASSGCRVHGSHGGGTWRSFAERLNQPLEADEHSGCACAGPRTAAEHDELFAPGMSARATWAEHASEVVPHTYVIDSVNLLSNDFRRLLRSGVTTVYVSPDPASVIGARGAIVKTGGDLGKRVVRRSDAVKAAMGGDPSRRGRPNALPGRGRGANEIDVFVRRPTTRMGVEWVFRKAFYDAQRYEMGLEISGADAPPVAAIPTLVSILKGETGLRIQARMQHDILTALRLAQEFKIRILIDEGTEAYRCLPELKATDTPVVYGPIFFTPSGFRAVQREVDEARLSTAAQLHAAGIRFCLTAQELRDEESLVRQAMMAAREGLPREAALAAVTSSPAALLGLGDRVGVLKPGAAGDLVIWSGDPLDAATRVKTVVIDGRVEYEVR